MGKYKFLIPLFIVVVAFCAAYIMHYRHLHRYDALIKRVSSSYGLDPALVQALIYEESYFDRDARSSAGAIGLMQVTPISVREWSRVTGKQRLSSAFRNTIRDRSLDISQLTDAELLTYPEINLNIGCWYLDQLMRRYADQKEPLPMVLASYNAGPTHALRWQERASARSHEPTTNQYIEQIDFPETKHYVRSIMSRYQKYKQNQSDSDMFGWLLRLASSFSSHG
ncbi:MAG: transglycosylase SLT domain-containing protein [Acidobacteriota bacterium]